MYTYQKCKQQLGAKKFDSMMLNNYNSHGRTKVQCNQCASEEANLLKELHLKLKRVPDIANATVLFTKKGARWLPAIMVKSDGLEVTVIFHSKNAISSMGLIQHLLGGIKHVEKRNCV